MKKLALLLVLVLILSGAMYWVSPGASSQEAKNTGFMKVISFIPNLIHKNRVNQSIEETQDGKYYLRTEHTKNYAVEATYPKTDDTTLNDLISKKIDGIISDFVSKNSDYKAASDDAKQTLKINISMYTGMGFDTLFIKKDYTDTPDRIMLHKIDSLLYSKDDKQLVSPDTIFNMAKLSEMVRSENKKMQETNGSQNVVDANETFEAFKLTNDKLEVSMPSFKPVTDDNFFSVDLNMGNMESIWNFSNPSFPQKLKVAIETEKAKRLEEEKKQEALRNQKLVALTFDDGPNKATTTQLLDVLKANDVKATFFTLAENIPGNEELVKRELAEGHQIGSHSQTHREMTKLQDKDVRYEVEKPDETIEAITGSKFTTMRPPYGSSNEHVRQIINKPIILWSVDTLDWKSRNAQAVEKEVMAHTFDGSIILMHDIYQSSVDAAKSFIPKLKEKGYVFVTINELFERRGIKLEPGKIYFQADKK